MTLLLALAAFALGAFMLSSPSDAAARGIRVHMKAPNHHPKAGHKWPIKVTVRKGHKKLHGRAHYKFLLGSTVVATRPGHKFKRGVYRDKLTWPRAAIGHRLKLRVVLKTNRGRAAVTWGVKVRK